MPDGLKRYQQSKQTHFVAFSCYQRLPYLQDVWGRDLLWTVIALVAAARDD
jgi:hypothetical protein